MSATRRGLGHPLQRRIRDEAAVPILLAFDLDRRKARRQRTARHDMLRPDGVSGGVEIDEIAGPDIDGARAEARHPGIEAIKIDQALQRSLERFGVIEAGRRERAARLQPGHNRSRGEEAACADTREQIGAHLVERDCVCGRFGRDP